MSIYVRVGAVGRMASMNRHDKIEKINAEIARMEVEYELECCEIKDNPGTLFLGENEHERQLGSSFGWITKKTKSTLTAKQRIDLFKKEILDEGLKTLRLTQLSNDVPGDVSIPDAVPCGVDEVRDYISFDGKYTGTFPVPNIVYHFTMYDRTYYVMVYVTESMVSFRVFKKLLDSKVKLSIASIKDIQAFSGDGKKNYDEVKGFLVIRVVKLHNTADLTLTNGVEK